MSPVVEPCPDVFAVLLRVPSGGHKLDSVAAGAGGGDENRPEPRVGRQGVVEVDREREGLHRDLQTNGSQ